MKKLLILFLMLSISAPLFAALKEKHLVGKWKYKVETDQGSLSGVFNFTKADGKITGNVVTDDGYTIPFTKIEIQGKNTLYLELQTNNDKIKVKVNVDGKNFKGTGSSSQGDAPITGEKVE